MNFVQMMHEKDALTANGALTNSTSHNANLDLFFLAGACRNEDVKNIELALLKSYNQDRLKTLKIIFWAGDIRQGAGERRFFKIALEWLVKNHINDIQNNLSLIPEFSRWDVIFELANTEQILFSFILSVLTNPEDSRRGLLCKWLPRKVYATDKRKTKTVSNNTTIVSVKKSKRLLYGGLARKLWEALKISPKEYRKLLVEGSKTVEQLMCAKKWSEINYPAVPSVAMNKYNKAWYRNDSERFEKYIENVKQGKSKINASAIFPHDILKSSIKLDFDWTTNSDFCIDQISEAQIAQWNSLPNWLPDEPNSILPICDVSGSMSGLPIQISLALGLYISERSQGPFKDVIMSFSERPRLYQLSGNIKERLTQMLGMQWGMNTDLKAVFDTILTKAISVKLAPEYMPKTILIISDMEFDSCCEYTNYEYIKNKYEQSGYEIPNIVFWNVNGRVGNIPCTINNKGVALVSGASPSIIKSVLTKNLDPVDIMNSIIETERYSLVR